GASDGAQFYVVRSRPITSLYPMIQEQPADDTLHVYGSFNHAQVMLDPIKPLGISVIQMLLPFGKDNHRFCWNSRFLQEAGGRLYFDITELLRHPTAHKILPQSVEVAGDLLATSINAVLQRPRFQREMKTARRISTVQAIRNLIGPMIARIVPNLLWRKPGQRAEQLEQYIRKHTAIARAELEAVAPGEARFNRMIKQLSSLFQTHLLKHFFPTVGASILAQKMLAKLSKKSFSDPLFSALALGLPGNITTEMDLRIADLSTQLKDLPKVLHCLETSPNPEGLQQIEVMEDGPEFVAAFQSLLDDFGMRAPAEIDITRTRWNEEPTPLLKMIVAQAKQPNRQDHRAHHHNLKQRGDEAGQTLIEEIRKQPYGWFKARIARRLIRVQRNLMGIREHHKYMMVCFLDIAKKMLKQEANRQVECGNLKQAQDFEFLTLEEISEMLREPPLSKDWDALIEERRQAHEDHKELSPPAVLTSEGEALNRQRQRDDIPEDALPGSPASSGTVGGIARVVHDPTEASLAEGEILVAPFTDPGWTPLFIHASG
ncbi:MAG: hypothetical protein AAGJ35_08750, partial [Myxococcota bacterium]